MIQRINEILDTVNDSLKIQPSIESLAGDIFVNNMMMGVVEVCAVTLLMFNLDRLPRRWVAMSTFLGSGTSYILSGLLGIYGEKGGYAENSSIYFAIVGKFFCSACYSSIYVYAVELYPTSCRNTGLASVLLSSRITSIIVPFIVGGEINISNEYSRCIFNVILYP